MRETWKDVPGYEGLYQVSNLGRVKSLRRKINSGLKYSGYKTIPDTILKPSKDKDGYNHVVLWVHNKPTTRRVCRLVATTYIPNPNNYPFVNHKDENKTNDFVWVNDDGSIDESKSNLEWCTAKYNSNYGTAIERRASKRRNGVLSKPVLQFNLDGTFVKEWESGAETRRAGFHHVSKCCNGKCKTSGGYIWKWK